ncbi:MAG TPA: hypothetical protein VFG66_01555 [Gemmatimonadales bacterium]|nr:hypothetical protein [Gemmatimonadales bacterium]
MNRRTGRRPPKRFALCIDSGEYPASLQRRKLYEVRPDADAETHGQLRVIDDSGEDYLYPREYFQPVKLTPFLSRLVAGRRSGRIKLPKPTRRAERVTTSR